MHSRNISHLKCVAGCDGQQSTISAEGQCCYAGWILGVLHKAIHSKVKSQDEPQLRRSHAYQLLYTRKHCVPSLATEVEQSVWPECEVFIALHNPLEHLPMGAKAHHWRALVQGREEHEFRTRTDLVQSLLVVAVPDVYKAIATPRGEGPVSETRSRYKGTL